MWAFSSSFPVVIAVLVIMSVTYCYDFHGDIATGMHRGEKGSSMLGTGPEGRAALCYSNCGPSWRRGDVLRSGDISKVMETNLLNRTPHLICGPCWLSNWFHAAQFQPVSTSKTYCFARNDLRTWFWTILSHVMTVLPRPEKILPGILRCLHV